MSTSTSLESWLEWKGQCALSKCSESVQTNLAGYGAPITKKFFHTFDPDLSIPGESAMDQWHLLESYMHTTSGVTGKRWKDWLFERAAGSSDDTVLVLEKTTYECIRTTVGKFCRDEGRTKAWQAGTRLVSKDAPITSEAEAPVLEDILSDFTSLDPASAADWRELRQIAADEAQRYFPTMDYHARVAMYANTLGLSLAEVEVERIAGRKSSTLYSILNLPGGGPECSRLLDELRLQIKRKYEAEDACTLHMLCHLTLNELSDICIQWAKSEKKCEPLLILSEQRMT